MKVKIKDLKPNPFRNFDLNPVDPERVKEHERSIQELGLFYPIKVRKNAQNLEIVFGHHRIEALRNLYGEDYEVEVEVVGYNDTQMLLALAKENDPVWNHSIREIDEMVSGAKRELEKMKKADAKKFREFANSLFSETLGNKQRVGIGAPLISAYLKWQLPRVEESLTRLNAIAQNIVDGQALYSFPTALSAMTFLRIMKQETVNPHDQYHLAQEIVQDGRLGIRSMKRTVYHFYRYRMMHTPRLTEKERVDIEYCERTLREVVKSINDAIYWMEEFGRGAYPYGMFVEPPTIDDIRPKTLEEFEAAELNFFKVRSKFHKWLKNLQENKEAEEDVDDSPKKTSISQ